MQEKGEITMEQLEDYKEFRRKVLGSFTLKPWERFNPDTYLSWGSLGKYYGNVSWKLFSSNL